MDKTNFVTEHIKKQIENKIYKVGDKIPGENTLCNELAVSRTTIRKAIKTLQEENIIYTILGSGSYVADRKKHINVHIDSHSILSELAEYNKQLIINVEKIITQKGYIFNLILETSDKEIIMPCSIDEVAGVIILSSSDNPDYSIYEQHNIPIVELQGESELYPFVKFQINTFHKKVISLLNKYNLKNNILFDYKDNVNLLKITADSYNFFIKNNYTLLPIETLQINLINTLDQYFRNLDFIPEAVVFLDNTIYQAAVNLFPKYKDIFEKTKIITHSNSCELFENKYKICRIAYKISDFSDALCDLLFKFIGNEKIIRTNILIEGQIIGENNLR